MKKLSTLGLILAVLGGVRAQEPPAEQDVVRLDPALNEVLAPDARLEKLASGFGYIQPGIWVDEGKTGYWLFTDSVTNTFNKWTPDGTVSVVSNRADWTIWPYRRPENARIGASGVTLDSQGRVVFCAEGDRAIVRLEKDGRRTILADRYEGKHLNSPNDLVYRSDGALYFTDPAGGERFAGFKQDLKLSYQGVFVLKDNRLRPIIRDMTRPNGIALSPDEKYLYVNDSVKRLIMRYELLPDGTVANGQVLVDMSADKTPGDPDGMKVDTNGNLYTNGPGGIWMMSPQGTHLGSLVPAEHSPGMVFGDPDRKTLYIAATTSLYRIRLKVEGVRPKISF